MSTDFAMPALDPELAQLLASPVEPDPPGDGVQEGDVVAATVHEVDADYVYVKLDEDQFGRCPVGDAALPGARAPVVGDAIRVLVERAIDAGLWEVAIGKAVLLERYDEVMAWPGGAPVEGTITLVLRGGFAVDVEGVRCFLPGRDSGIRQADAFRVLGSRMRFEVTRVETKHGMQPVLSRRRLVADDRKAMEKTRLAELAEGQVITGAVTSIQPFGVFVDLDGVDGLCHVSELSVQHIDNPREVVDVGDTITVKVMEIDVARGRVGVSRRELLVAEQRARLGSIEAGTVIEGTVTRLADFGAFVAIEEGVEGLCHVSELAWTGRPSHPGDVLAVGQRVQMRVVTADAQSGRIALSLKAMTENPWASVTDRAPAGSVVTGTITRIEDYGLFVRLAEGIEGLCHVSDLTWVGRPERPTDVAPYTVGQSLDVKVLSVDTERGRISLGVKQLAGDPWDEAGDRTTVGAVFTAPVEGLEGRLYIAEVSTERVDSIRAALRMGQEVEVMTIAADRTRRRLDLSIKAIQAKIEAETPKSFADGEAISPMAAALAKSGLVGDSET